MADDFAARVPEFCSLATAERQFRAAEFDRLFADSVTRWARVSSRRLDLILNATAELTARDLAAREVDCCSFFTFRFGSTRADVLMTIEVPPAQTHLLDALTERVSAVIAARTRR